MIWRCGEYEFGSTPAVMGVLNVTPDSFSDGGGHNDCEEALAFGLGMVADGAAIVDVGGESTRPGSSSPDIKEEIRRVLPVVQGLADAGVCVSIDTRHVEVAKACLEAGAKIVNDISGFRDPAMCELVAKCDCGLVVMHMQGEPKTMQESPCYTDVVAEVEAYLLGQAAKLESLGVASERICIDAGIGFGKTLGHNHKLMAATRRLASHGYSLMAAVSRKSYIGQMTGIEAPAKRDAASALCAAAACSEGALVVRAHNVSKTLRALAGSRRAIVALGSNLGDRCGYLDAALEALRKTPGIWVFSVSDYVETEPAYKEDQDLFANAVAQVQTTLGPYELLDVLHGIEQAQHRVRHEANGPRTLDLDILDYQGVVSDDPVLTLPHPRLLERDFAVTPLLQIAPGYVFANGVPVADDGVRYGRITRILQEK